MENRDGLRSPRQVLFNVCLGSFMTALNHRAMLVSLPTLTRVFATSVGTIQWALLVYDLILVGLVLTLGCMGDLFGRKRIYISGFVVFALGSVLCGLSRSPSELIAFRILQSLGGAMLTANGRALISVAFPSHERGKALGFTQMAFHLGFLTGPTLGGFLLDTVGWRWIFFLNVPVGLAGAYLASKILTEHKHDPVDARIDFFGAFMLLMTNGLFLYGLNEIPHLGVRHPGVAAFTARAAISLLLFIRAELRAESPILSLSLFRNRLFSAANLSLFFITSTQSAIHFLMPFYLQSIMEFTPSQMGWIIITNSVVIIAVGPVAGWLSDRLGSRLLCTAGAAVIVAAQFLVARLTRDATVYEIIAPLALAGLGWAIFNSPNQSAILGSVSPNKLGVAAGMATTTARLGGAMGIAVSAALFTYGLAASGLSPRQVESPELWSSSPALFMASFRHTVYIISFSTILSVLASAARGPRAAPRVDDDTPVT